MFFSVKCFRLRTCYCACEWNVRAKSTRPDSILSSHSSTNPNRLSADEIIAASNGHFGMETAPVELERPKLRDNANSNEKSWWMTKNNRIRYILH